MKNVSKDWNEQKIQESANYSADPVNCGVHTQLF